MAKKKPIRKSKTKATESLWKGPYADGGDGITFSLLSRFLVCRERFRLQVVEGLRETEAKFPHALEYGSLWHEAEEALAGGNDWQKAVRKYGNKLRAEYPADGEDVQKWVALCCHQFPLYVKHWQKHPTQTKRTPVLEEVAFRVPYQLPSGRTILLRGKWDAVFQFGKRSLYLQENKTKGNIDEEGITKTVDRNLQSMLYQIALRTAHDKDSGSIDTGGPFVECAMGLRVAGTLYNVVRRPLSDRYAPRQRKAETAAEFYKRAGSEVVSANPDHWFKRWKVEIGSTDLRKFQDRTFNPLLEQLCDWWDWIAAAPYEPFRIDPDTGIPGGGVHWMYPWGVYNSIAGGWRGDYFDFLTTGSRVGLRKVGGLFPELEDE